MLAGHARRIQAVNLHNCMKHTTYWVASGVRRCSVRFEPSPAHAAAPSRRGPSGSLGMISVPSVLALIDAHRSMMQ